MASYWRNTLTSGPALVLQVQNLLMQVCDETSNIAEVQLKVQLHLLWNALLRYC